MKTFPCDKTSSRQRGAALFTVLTFLVILTLLAVVAVGTSILQERMTGGLRNAQLSQMGADSAVRGVEFAIWNAAANGNGSSLTCGYNGAGSSCYTPRSVAGVDASGNPVTRYQTNPVVAKFRTAHGWLDEEGAAYATADMTRTDQATARLAKQPRYLIEYLGRLSPPGAPNHANGGAIYNAGGQTAGADNVRVYRITARSVGGNDGSVRAAESVFTAPPPSN